MSVQLSPAETARIEADVMAGLLADCAATILDTTYIPRGVLSGRVFTYRYARRRYDAARRICDED